jgi:xanthine dehydrogenase YagS FAD-binding subunit
MEQFKFRSATTPAQAIQSGSQTATAQMGATVRFVAGGTNLVDLMKLNVEKPLEVIDINALPMDKVEPLSGGGLKIGALVRNSDLSYHAAVIRDYPVLSQALLSGASPQLRNMATTGGNLLQRTRCVYFRDTVHRCNKRNPGSGCDAMEGYNRMHAVLGTSDQCIATNPSDMNVAMMALEATIHVQGPKGERSFPISELYVLPGKTPNIETILQPGDLITHVTLPALASGTKSVYLKLRDRAAYEFALASAAVVMQVNGGKIQRVRVALGGVGTIPWRSHEAERALEGKQVSRENFRHAAELALASARPHSENAFKVELSKRCIVRALSMVTA